MSLTINLYSDLYDRCIITFKRCNVYSILNYFILFTFDPFHLPWLFILTIFGNFIHFQIVAFNIVRIRVTYRRQSLSLNIRKEPLLKRFYKRPYKNLMNNKKS